MARRPLNEIETPRRRRVSARAVVRTIAVLGVVVVAGGASLQAGAMDRIANTVRPVAGAPSYGMDKSTPLNDNLVALASTPTGKGYWVAAADGGVFARGDARFYGSAGSLKLTRPVVGIAATPGGDGYWLVAADGGVFAYGSARFYGSLGGRRLNGSDPGHRRDAERARLLDARRRRRRVHLRRRQVLRIGRLEAPRRAVRLDGPHPDRARLLPPRGRRRGLHLRRRQVPRRGRRRSSRDEHLARPHGRRLPDRPLRRQCPWVRRAAVGRGAARRGREPAPGRFDRVPPRRRRLAGARVQPAAARPSRSRRSRTATCRRTRSSSARVRTSPTARAATAR